MQTSNKFSGQNMVLTLSAGVALSMVVVTGSAYLLSGLLKLYHLIGVPGKYISGSSVVFWAMSVMSMLPFVAIVCVLLGMRLKENSSLVGVLVGLSAAVGYAVISAFVETRATTGYLIDMTSIVVFSFLFARLGGRVK